MDSFNCAGCTEVVDYYKDRACKELLVIHAESTATLIKAENEKLHSEKKQSSEEIENLIQENKTLKESLQNEKDKRKLVEEKLDMITKELKHEKFEVIKLQKELEDTMQLLSELEQRNAQAINTESKSSKIITENERQVADQKDS